MSTPATVPPTTPSTIPSTTTPTEKGNEVLPPPPPMPKTLMPESTKKSEDLLLKEEHDDKRCGASYGVCKWFSDKSGYGFITVLSQGVHKGKEIFVHYTGIKPMNSTYKTLLSGEYLSFDIVQGLKDLQAVNVLGINGGPLFCDSNPNIKFITPKIKPPGEEKENKDVKTVAEKTVTEGIIGHYDGICKWFNDVSGYGFLVIETGDNAGKDVFVHYTGITPLTSQYKSLVSGEYLSFDIIKGIKGLQAVNVTGYNGGPLLCDVNHIPKTTTQPRDASNGSNSPPRRDNRDNRDSRISPRREDRPRHTTTQP